MSEAKTSNKIGRGRGLSWWISLKVVCFVAVMKARGFKVFWDEGYINQKNNYLSLLSGITLIILAVSGLYRE